MKDPRKSEGEPSKEELSDYIDHLEKMVYVLVDQFEDDIEQREELLQNMEELGNEMEEFEEQLELKGTASDDAMNSLRDAVDNYQDSGFDTGN